MRGRHVARSRASTRASRGSTPSCRPEATSGAGGEAHRRGDRADRHGRPDACRTRPRRATRRWRGSGTDSRPSAARRRRSARTRSSTATIASCSTRPAEYESITADDVKQAAATVLRADNRTVGRTRAESGRRADRGCDEGSCEMNRPAEASARCRALLVAFRRLRVRDGSRGRQAARVRARDARQRRVGRADGEARHAADLDGGGRARRLARRSGRQGGHGVAVRRADPEGRRHAERRAVRRSHRKRRRQLSTRAPAPRASASARASSRATST